MLSTVFSSPHQTLKPSFLPHLKTNSFSRSAFQNHDQIVPCPSCSTKIRSHEPSLSSSFLGFSRIKRFGLSYSRQWSFSVKSGKGDGGESKNSNGSSEEAENLARGESTMPERFRHLTKQAPGRPLRWPWFVGKCI